MLKQGLKENLTIYLSYLCEYYGLPEVAAYWESVVNINVWQTERFFQNILTEQFNNLTEKIIVLLGFAFKQETGDTRDSPAIPLCNKLIGEHARVRIHDPQAIENAKIDLKEMDGDISFFDDVYEAIKGAKVIALITHGKEYKELDFKRIYDHMLKPAFIFDGRNHLEHERLYDIGFNVFPLGKTPMKHE